MAYQNSNHDELDHIAKLDDKVDIIHMQITEYLKKTDNGRIIRE